MSTLRFHFRLNLCRIRGNDKSFSYHWESARREWVFTITINTRRWKNIWFHLVTLVCSFTGVWRCLSDDLRRNLLKNEYLSDSQTRLSSSKWISRLIFMISNHQMECFSKLSESFLGSLCIHMRERDWKEFYVSPQFVLRLKCLPSPAVACLSSTLLLFM